MVPVTSRSVVRQLHGGVDVVSGTNLGVRGRKGAATTVEEVRRRCGHGCGPFLVGGPCMRGQTLLAEDMTKRFADRGSGFTSNEIEGVGIWKSHFYNKERQTPDAAAQVWTWTMWTDRCRCRNERRLQGFTSCPMGQECT